MHPFNKIVTKIKQTIRYKLLVLGLFPIVLILPITLALAIIWGATFTYKQLYIKVNTDLSVAHDIFKRIREGYLNDLRYLGDSYQFRRILERGDPLEIQHALAALKKQKGFSYLLMLNVMPNKTGQGQQLDMANPRASSSLFLAAKGRESVGVEIFSGKQLKNISNALFQQAQLNLIATPRAQPIAKSSEDRGMVIRALYPIKNSQGHTIAVLDGGVLLNQNFNFVDTIRDLVYGTGSLARGSIGTVTVFLDDIRINTNVPLAIGERALGTRVSEEVRTQVLDRGEVWVARAFVVNDWYISSYEPILNTQGNTVGMLYAGYSEAPYRSALWRAVVALLILFLSLMSLSAWLAVRGAKSIFKPIELISTVVKKMSSGNMTSRIGQLQSDDELGQLANGFDHMLDLLQRHSDEIQTWADQLEIKVSERTAELQQKNQQLKNTIHALRETRKQLLVAEKLAALGEFTAGIAHEINNPTQVMLGSLDVLMSEMGEQLAPIKPEINLVVKQVYRIQSIINSLLQYAKPDEFAGYINQIQVNDVIKESELLIQHMRKDYEFELILILHSSVLVQMNEKDLQQVLVNLMVNAVHALPKSGGIITVESTNWGKKGVSIKVSDNGSGINEDKIDHVFNPFFSTKKHNGYGLGLSVSYGLIRKYGGNITLTSSPNIKTEFTISLLETPDFEEDEETIIEHLNEIEKMSETL